MGHAYQQHFPGILGEEEHGLEHERGNVDQLPSTPAFPLRVLLQSLIQAHLTSAVTSPTKLALAPYFPSPLGAQQAEKGPVLTQKHSEQLQPLLGAGSPLPEQ